MLLVKEALWLPWLSFSLQSACVAVAPDHMRTYCSDALLRIRFIIFLLHFQWFNLAKMWNTARNKRTAVWGSVGWQCWHWSSYWLFVIDYSFSLSLSFLVSVQQTVTFIDAFLHVFPRHHKVTTPEPKERLGTPLESPPVFPSAPQLKTDVFVGHFCVFTPLNPTHRTLWVLTRSVMWRSCAVWWVKLLPWWSHRTIRRAYL